VLHDRYMARRQGTQSPRPAAEADSELVVSQGAAK